MTKKIDSSTEAYILELMAKGLTYKDIVKAIKREKGIDLTIMAISHLKTRIKKYITKDYANALAVEQQIDLDLKRSSLSRCLEIALELSERNLMRLRALPEMDKGEIKMLNETIDRLVKLRSILHAQMIMSKEIQFPAAALTQKYEVKKSV